MVEINRVVVLGANGTMGAACGQVFASGGCQVAFLARSVEKAQQGIAMAQDMARATRVADRIAVGTYDADLAAAVSGADLIFEALGEDLSLKKGFFERIDRHRRSDSLVVTVSSGLSIAEMARDRSESFRRHFLGMHLFNPPHIVVGTEVIPHAESDPALVAKVVRLLERRFGRVVIVAADKPGFAGNRIGFKVLNEVAALAGEHGVAFMDYLIGPHTGRAMPPLATVDLVGWDVHKAIVDNVHAHTRDEASDAFRLPGYMATLIDRGHLGDKTPAQGGFYRCERNGAGKRHLVLDTATGGYRDVEERRFSPLPFVERMKELNRVGRHREAFATLANATGHEADLARRVVLGYISYGLNRVGENEVVGSARDIDRIMAFGFNWAPPSALVDVIGARTTARLLDSLRLPVPPAVERAAGHPDNRLFHEPNVNPGRFFRG